MERNLYRSPNPYPPIRVSRPSNVYAEMMLSNMGGSNSEMSAVSLYLYNHFVTIDSGSLSETFEKIAVTEMHHLDIFGQTAYLLGGDPRLWSKSLFTLRYWTPSYNKYYESLDALLENALESELAAIEKYRSQMSAISDSFILDNLARIIEDEELHVELFKQLQRAY